MYGCNPESRKYEFHWVANTAEDLLESIGTPEENVKISFVPPEWVPVFEQHRFTVYAKYNNYFMQNLDTVSAAAEPEFLTEAGVRGSVGSHIILQGTEQRILRTDSRMVQTVD